MSMAGSAAERVLLGIEHPIGSEEDQRRQLAVAGSAGLVDRLLAISVWVDIIVQDHGVPRLNARRRPRHRDRADGLPAGRKRGLRCILSTRPLPTQARASAPTRGRGRARGGLPTGLTMRKGHAGGSRKVGTASAQKTSPGGV